MPLLDDGKEWGVFHGDAIPHMLTGKEGGMSAESVDFTIFSPPFPIGFCLYRF